MQVINGEKHWEKGDFSLLEKEIREAGYYEERHKLRYAMFRLKTETSGGNPAELSHWEIWDNRIKDILPDDKFEISNFAEKWDIARVHPQIQIVRRLWSVEQEHAQMMNRISVEVTKADTPETLQIKAKRLEEIEKRRLKREEKKLQRKHDKKKKKEERNKR